MKTLVVMWLITIALLIGGCAATSSNKTIEINVPFDQMVLRPLDDVTMLVYIVESVELGRHPPRMIVLREILEYQLMAAVDSDGVTHHTLWYSTKDNISDIVKAIDIPYKEFKVYTERRSYSEPRID